MCKSAFTKRELLAWNLHLCKYFHIQVLPRVKPIINVSVKKELFRKYFSSLSLREEKGSQTLLTYDSYKPSEWRISFSTNHGPEMNACTFLPSAQDCGFCICYSRFPQCYREEGLSLQHWFGFRSITLRQKKHLEYLRNLKWSSQKWGCNLLLNYLCHLSRISSRSYYENIQPRT